MRRVILFLVLCAVVVAIAWWVAGLPGTVSASLAGLSIQTATPVAILLLAALVLVLQLLLTGLIGLLRLPGRVRGWRQRRQRARGDVAVTRTLVAIAAGEVGDSRLYSQRARKWLGDTPQTLLLAAEAGRLGGQDGDAEALYQQLAEREDAAFLGLRGLFRLAMAREDWTAAAALARRAEDSHPSSAWLREERTMLAVRTGDWKQAQRLAEPGPARIAYAAAAAEAEPDAAVATKLAKRAWTATPGFAPAALAYARRLRAAGREGRAFVVARDAWKAAPHPDLARFALEPTPAGLAQVKLAEKLVQPVLAHPESQLLLARTSLDAGLVGEARRHAEQAGRAGLDDRRLWLLLADIETREHGSATEAAQAALLRAATAQPGPTWRCDACGTPQPTWHALCPTCQTPGRVGWSGELSKPARLGSAQTRKGAHAPLNPQT
jgi:HemY protein